MDVMVLLMRGVVQNERPCSDEHGLSGYGVE